jgi:uncharacterized protein (DUF697 family)
LGKAQSGKTSIIRAITGASRAEIGDGFRPCTRTARIYAFPSEENCFVRFLDTRGLGEVDYDPSDDIRVIERQAHCLIVVMKAMDHAQGSVLAPLKSILKARRDWPLIVAQTALHEGYVAPGDRHIRPYPYSETPFPPQVPQDLARSLLSQRQWIAGDRARFVPIDFTLPEDGLEPEHYGLDALWTAIEDAVALGLRAMLQHTRKPLRDVYFRTAMPHILSYSVLAGAAALVPIPLLDIPVVAGVQAKMLQSIASVYGQKVTRQTMAEVFSALGLGIAARLGGRELLKLIPAWGATAAGLFAAASTYALGCTLCTYFSYVREGDVPEPKVLRELYKQEYEEGRRRLAKYLKRVGGGRGAGQ